MFTITSGNIRRTYDLPVHNSNVTSGSCGAKTQNILIEWHDKNRTNGMNLLFKLRTNHESTYSLDEIAFNLSTALFIHNDNSTLKLFHDAVDFTTWLHWSYLCEKDQKLPLYTEKRKQYVGTIEVSHIWLEAFHVQNKKSFSSHIDCKHGLSTKRK